MNKFLNITCPICNHNGRVVRSMVCDKRLICMECGQVFPKTMINSEIKVDKPKDLYS